MFSEINGENWLSDVLGAYRKLTILSESTEIYSILSVDFHKVPLNNHHFFFFCYLSRFCCAICCRKSFNGQQLLGNGTLLNGRSRWKIMCSSCRIMLCKRVNRDIFGYEPESLIKTPPTSIKTFSRLFNCALMRHLTTKDFSTRFQLVSLYVNLKDHIWESPFGDSKKTFDQRSRAGHEWHLRRCLRFGHLKFVISFACTKCLRSLYGEQ